MSQPLPRVVFVRALPTWRLELRYDDGASGIVDLADLAGHGVFAAWLRPGGFDGVTLSPHGSISWGDDVEICPDSMYLRLTGKTPDQVFTTGTRSGRNA